MILPFRSEIANYNIYGEYDMYARNKFIGMIKPDGELFNCGSDHGFGPVLNSLNHFFSCAMRMDSKEACVSYLIKLKENKEKFMYHNDRNFLIPLLGWQINYASLHFGFDSEFMKEYMKIFIDSEGNQYNRFASDYVVQLTNFHKVERLPLTITTSSINIYEPFFNYLLMDFSVRQIPAVVFNEEKGDFCYYRPDDFITLGTERELEEEIRLIKKYVPLSERHKYFR